MKSNLKNIFDIPLDLEEEELSKALENEKPKRLKNFKEEKKLAEQAALNYFRKDARVTLRLSNADLDKLKQKAAYKGLPYQTFIASVLHEYAAGHFTEN